MYEGREIEILMRVIKQTETATERQVWESVVIDSLAGKDPKGCLNLKNEWGHSKNPSLETKTWRPRNKPSEPSRGKRVKKTENWEPKPEEPERSEAKRVRTRSPERGARSSETGAPERERETAEATATASGASTPVLTKVRRIQARIDKETQSKKVPSKTTRKMIQPTLVSFMDIRSGLKGQERAGNVTPSRQATDCRVGLGASSQPSFSPEHGEERVRPPMRGSPEHLLLQEARVTTKGRDGSRHRKRLRGAESLEPKESGEKPGGRNESSISRQSETGNKGRP